MKQRGKPQFPLVDIKKIRKVKLQKEEPTSDQEKDVIDERVVKSPVNSYGLESVPLSPGHKQDIRD